MLFRSSGEYLAGASGTIDTSRDVSVGGTFRGVGDKELLCSMLPVPPEELDDYIRTLHENPSPRTGPLMRDSPELLVEVTAKAAGRLLGPIRVQRRYVAAGVEIEQVDAGGVQGVYYAPPRTTRQGMPVLVLGGSEGGVPTSQATLLASRGHPALAFAYFNYRNRPPALVNIPLEQFADAVSWLRTRTKARNVAIVGTSRGTEAAQLTAAHLPQGIGAVVLFAPSHVSNAGFGAAVTQPESAWTLRGQGVNYPPARPELAERMRAAVSRDATRAPGFSAAPYFLEAWTDPAGDTEFVIPVESIRARVLVFAGTADAMWPSAMAAERIAARMAQHGRARQVQVVTYPGAGHGISRLAYASELSTFAVHPVTKNFVSLGGVAAFNCEAAYDSFGRFLRLLAEVN